MKDKLITFLAKTFGKKMTSVDIYQNTKSTLIYYKFLGRLYITGIEQVTIGESGIWGVGIAERITGVQILTSKAIKNLGKKQS